MLSPLRVLAGPSVYFVWLAALGLACFAVSQACARGVVRRFNPPLASAVAALVVCVVGSFGLIGLRDTLTGVALGLAGSTAAAASPVAWVNLVLASCTAGLLWLSLRSWTDAGAAALGTAAVAGAAPFLIAAVSGGSYPAAALLVTISVIWPPSSARLASWPEYLIRGLAAAGLAMLSIAYVPLAAAIAVVLAIRVRRHPQALLAAIVPATVGIVRQLAAAHPPLLSLANPAAGVVGLLTDQELGLLPYAPALALALVGLVRALGGSRPPRRRLACEIGVLFAVALFARGSSESWWGSSAVPAGPLVPVLPLLALPLAWSYFDVSRSARGRAILYLVVLLQAGAALALLFVERGTLILQDRDGSARLFQWMATLWPAWQMLPSVAVRGLQSAVPIALVWSAAAIILFLLALRPRPAQKPGAAGLSAFWSVAIVSAAAACLVSAATAAAPAADPAARARVPILDAFDAARRPHAIVFRSFAPVPASAVPPLMALTASPGLRTEPQPLPVLLNARFALPAGLYAVEVGAVPDGQRVSGRIGLQVGRIGSPLCWWEIDLPAGAAWRGRFALPVDAEFVGFVASGAVASARSLTVRPVEVEDRSARELPVRGGGSPVLSALNLPGASLFFRDEAVYLERTGFWVRGRSTASITIAPADPNRRLVLHMHSGKTANTVTFMTTTWGARVALKPGAPYDLEVPAPPHPGPFVLRVTTEGGFTPADSIPGSSDRRLLGCWIEIAEAE